MLPWVPGSVGERAATARTALRRAAQREEIAEAVVWLLSDRASYVTGVILLVAGGAGMGSD